MIGFVTLLALAATLLSFLAVIFDFGSIDMEELASQLPDFTLADGRLYMEEDFLYDESGIFVYMTEDIDGFSYEDAAELAAEGYQDVMLVGRDSISLMQDGQYQQADFADFGDTLEISREWCIHIDAACRSDIDYCVYYYLFGNGSRIFPVCSGLSVVCDAYCSRYEEESGYGSLVSDGSIRQSSDVHSSDGSELDSFCAFFRTLPPSGCHYVRVYGLCHSEAAGPE